MAVSVVAWADANRQIGFELVQRYDPGTGAAQYVAPQVINVTTVPTRYVLVFDLPLVAVAIGDNNALQLTGWLSTGSGFTARSGVGIQSGTFNVTGLQVESGTTFSSFDFRPEALELTLCQRYYEKSYDVPVSPGTALAAAGVVQAIAVPPSDGGFFRVLIPYSVTKRVNPAVTLYSPVTGASGAARNAYSEADITGSINAVGSSHHCVAAIPSQPTGNRVEMHFTADAEL